jgi:hypothetical protein
MLGLGTGPLLWWSVDDTRLHVDLVMSLGLLGELDRADRRPGGSAGEQGRVTRTGEAGDLPQLPCKPHVSWRPRCCTVAATF